MQKKRISFLTIVFVLFFSLLTEGNAVLAAEKSLKLDQLVIQILPEYTNYLNDKEQDGPPLMVVYFGTIKNTSDEPQKGQFKIPLPVEQKNFRLGFVGAVDKKQEDVTEVKYNFDKKTGIVSWKTNDEIDPNGSYKFMIEFYTTDIKESGEKKQLDYQFKSFTNIGMVHLIFVEPLETDSFKLSPEPTMKQTNSSNLNMYSYIFKNVETDKKITVHLKYERKEEQTTKEIMASMTSSGMGHSESGENESTMPGWEVAGIIGGISLIAVAVLIFVLWRRSKRLTRNVDEMKEEKTEGDMRKELIQSMLSDGRITKEEYDSLIRNMKDGEHDE